jgi:hypothetical protein
MAGSRSVEESATIISAPQTSQNVWQSAANQTILVCPLRKEIRLYAARNLRPSRCPEFLLWVSVVVCVVRTNWDVPGHQSQFSHLRE